MSSTALPSAPTIGLTHQGLIQSSIHTRGSANSFMMASHSASMLNSQSTRPVTSPVPSTFASSKLFDGSLDDSSSLAGTAVKPMFQVLQELRDGIPPEIVFPNAGRPGKSSLIDYFTYGSSIRSSRSVWTCSLCHKVFGHAAILSYHTSLLHIVSLNCSNLKEDDVDVLLSALAKVDEKYIQSASKRLMKVYPERMGKAMHVTKSCSKKPRFQPYSKKNKKMKNQKGWACNAKMKEGKVFSSLSIDCDNKDGAQDKNRRKLLVNGDIQFLHHLTTDD